MDASWDLAERDPRLERGSVKWDRAARYLRVAMLLHAHPEGIGAGDIAQRIGASKRTVYRDLRAMNEEAGLPLWQDAGKWGLEEGAFLPPLKLTLHEAMTLFLAARVLAKASDEHDTELIGAFVKLAQVLPPVLAEHIQATVDAVAQVPRNERFTRVFRTLTEAWADRRVVEIVYDASAYDANRSSRRTQVRPYLIEPSALTHALYLVGWDEAREARRTFKVERILEASLTPRRFQAEPGTSPARDLLRAWDVISDEDPVQVVIRFEPSVARRAAETRWHPSQETEVLPDGSLRWSGRVAGLREIRVWILGWGADAEVLQPAALRRDVAEELRRAAGRYGSEPAPVGGSPVDVPSAVVAPAAVTSAPTTRRAASRSRANQ
ncbi:MAG: WYL domain-containing transcriptional regulator [Chloroflexi bacterium]|nr:WYL domain-containing transcriptional regulator [Chloroflexota bacterium]MBA3851728.1 WYL domain-containing transcriptional regulator [Chloroflexota bacterium]